MPSHYLNARFNGRKTDKDVGVASTLPSVTGLLMGDKKKKKKSMLGGKLTQLAASKGGLGGYSTLSERDNVNANG